ncbi:MAG: benzoate-CoA ligase family protein [Gemmatimonadetes bacterium]|nr:benzoate-CoA ligase family protein [Gemmatimonadota bacterium]
MTFEPPTTFNVFDFFLGDRIAEGSGARRALLTDAGEWSYSQVHDLSGRYSRILLDSGVQPGDRVVIALPDGPDYVGALFGALRMGGVVVMINPQLASDQIRYFFDYTGSVAALVDEDVMTTFTEAADAAAQPGPTLVSVGGPAFEARLSDVDPDVITYPCSPDDAAIFLFSGGTTGDPKAVVQTHRSFANTTELYGKGILGMRAEDVTLSVPKLFFGYATGTNLLFPFSVGATAALFPERCTAETLFEKIARFRPTVLVNVPTMVNNLVGHETVDEQDFSSLRLATSAGEALPEELHRRWNEHFGVPLLDGLGTAEMWHIFISNTVDDLRPGTLGKVVPGFEVRACEADGTEVGVGEVGVMWVRGDSLALGYWQDEDKTRLAFRDGWFVSSDMIRIDAEGYVSYGGRADDMLKVSGKWLSPVELENCLLEHAGVREAVVVGMKTADGLVKPSAFVVLEDGVAASDQLATELQDWAKGRLEPYKYPRSIAFLADLPRTHLGKVDRGGLARRDTPASE